MAAGEPIHPASPSSALVYSLGARYLSLWCANQPLPCSRSAIKKYVLVNNKSVADRPNVFDAQFNKAVRTGVEKNEFAQPKGRSLLGHIFGLLLAFNLLSEWSARKFPSAYGLVRFDRNTNPSPHSPSNADGLSGPSGTIKIAKKEPAAKKDPDVAKKPAAAKVASFNLPGFIR